MADLQISEFPGSLPADTDILHTKKASGEDNKTTVAAIKQHVLDAIPEDVQYHELPTKAINGADIIKFENANQETYHKSTFLALKNYIGNLLFPVGSLYHNYSNDTNPAILLGFGSWVKIEGMFVSAAGSATDAGGTNRTFTAGAISGRHTVQLQTSEMPSHEHKMFGESAFGGSAISASGEDQTVAVENSQFSNTESYRMVKHGGLYKAQATRGSTSRTGSNAHHENTPLNVAAHIWRRVA